ncbi:MAG: site-specific DNA-methyltransferase, partial [Myxococcota bacterium]
SFGSLPQSALLMVEVVSDNECLRQDLLLWSAWTPKCPKTHASHMPDIQIRKTEAIAALHDLEDESFDAVITDPPYSSGGLHRKNRTKSASEKYSKAANRDELNFDGDMRDQRSFVAWCSVWMHECWRVTRPGGVMAVFTDWRQLPVTTDAVQAGGWIWRGIVPWDKGLGTRPRIGGFRAQAEYVVWASRGELPQKPEVGALPGAFACTIKRSDRHHLTGKPTELMREIVKVCPPGGRILDPFAGSGTTLVAAALEGRGALGFELSSNYVAATEGRLGELRASAP